MNRLAVNLRRLRKGRGWTQQELAGKANVPQSSIHYIERGVRNPRVSTVEKLAVALGVDIVELLREWPADRPGR
ncbi:MAG: helix-turn-helix transcriptional regulator [Desulfosporosinus sp.]|nr:helix-turn-helix transcriptional regulator [Desulfosporosinus sp.]